MTGATVRYPLAARSLLRDTVLDAVNGLARSRGWSATTMAHVASAAGVSRQTLYNEFGSRSSLVEAFVAREIQNLIDRVSTDVRANADDAHLALRIAFARFLELASDEPLMQIILGDAEAGELQRLLTGVGQQIGVLTVGELIPEVWPQVSSADGRLLADVVVRLAVSHAFTPGEDPSLIADTVGRALAPLLDQLLAGQVQPPPTHKVS